MNTFTRRFRYLAVAGSALALSAFGLVAAGSAGTALAGGTNPGGPGPYTLTWTGQGATNGVLDTTQCTDNLPAGVAANQPYLLWLLTTDGGSVQVDNTTPVLTVNGSPYYQGDGSQSNSVHFVTPYYTPDSSLQASADMQVLTAGRGDWSLKISHGCPGTVTPPSASPLTISKTATGSYDTTWKWDIAKAADKTEIDSADGSATFNYMVTVSHDPGTDSNVQVSGTIDVTDPNSVPVQISGLTDTLSDGTTQSVSGPATLQPGDNNFPYSFSLGQLPSGSLDNTATVTWDDQTLSDGSVLKGDSAAVQFSNISFEQKKIDATVTVTDSLGGTLGTVSASDPSPRVFTYQHTFTGDPAGTCTSHDNTATITETGQAADQKVRVCVGADLQVSKDATPSFTRTYKWKIAKSADKTVIDPGGKVNYTVQADETGFADSDWQVKGTVHVTNPNDWESVTLGGLTDAVDNGGTCTVSGSPAGTVLAPKGQPGDSADFPYTCTYPQSGPTKASGTNTATATWDPVAAFTSDGSASGSKDFAFDNPTSTVNKTVTVTDSQGGALGTAGPATDDPASFVSQQFTYSKTFSPPASGCVTVNNTATITETGQTASASVKNCNSGALTMGFWQNKNGQAIITGGASTSGVCNSGAWLRQYAPFQDLSATATCSQVAAYVTNVIKAANASGASMNAMLKAQMLSTALDVYFGGGQGGNKINAPAPIGDLSIDLSHICKMIDGSGGTATCSGTYENTSSAFGGTSPQKISDLLSYAAGQSNVGGSSWYGQVKATQQLAKDTFDAINNQAALGS